MQWLQQCVTRLLTDRNVYLAEVTNDILPFWLKYGWDREYGGIVTYVDRHGRWLCHDKSVWFQGRTVWTYSYAYNYIERKEEWLDFANSCRNFMQRYCFDNSDQRMYFAVTRDGKPLRKRRYLFSESFAIIGLAENSVANSDFQQLLKAYDLFKATWARVLTPDETTPPKINPQVRPIENVVIYMIMLNTARCLKAACKRFPTFEVEEMVKTTNGVIDYCRKTILDRFYNASLGTVVENVLAGGTLPESPVERMFSPGHAIETGVFLLESALDDNDLQMADVARAIIERGVELGWDGTSGGLFYFVDWDGQPAHDLTSELKLWWVHVEALYGLLLAFLSNPSWRLWEKYEHVRDYTLHHFPDPLYGEWLGYLRRDGSALLSIKGNMWKGPFHIPRALMNCALAIERHISRLDAGQTNSRERR